MPTNLVSLQLIEDHLHWLGSRAVNYYVINCLDQVQLPLNEGATLKSSSIQWTDTSNDELRQASTIRIILRL